MTGVLWHPVPCDLAADRASAASPPGTTTGSCRTPAACARGAARRRSRRSWTPSASGRTSTGSTGPRGGGVRSRALAGLVARLRPRDGDDALVRWASSFCGGGKDADAEAAAAAPTEDGTTAGVTVSVPESSKVKSDAAAEGTEKKHHGLKRHNTGHGLKGQRRHSLRESRKKLDEMRAKAFTIRVRVSGVLVQVGFSCVVLTMTCFLNIGKWFKIAPPNGGHMPLVGCALPIGLALMLLGLFPIDATAIRVVCAMIFSLIAFIILFMGSFLLLDPHGPVQGYCHPEYGSAEACRNSIIIVGVILLGFIAACAALVPTLVCSCCSNKFAMAARALRPARRPLLLRLPRTAGDRDRYDELDRDDGRPRGACGIRGASDQVQEVENGSRASDFALRLPVRDAGFDLVGSSSRLSRRRATAAASTAGSSTSARRAITSRRRRRSPRSSPARRRRTSSARGPRSALPLSAARGGRRTEPGHVDGGTPSAPRSSRRFLHLAFRQDDGPAKLRSTAGRQAARRRRRQGAALGWIKHRSGQRQRQPAALPVFLSAAAHRRARRPHLRHAPGTPRSPRARSRPSRPAPLRQVRRRALHVPAHGRRPRSILVYRLSLDSKLGKTLGKFDALKAVLLPRDRRLLMIVEAGFGDVAFNKRFAILDNVEATSAALPTAAGSSGSSSGLPPHWVSSSGASSPTPTPRSRRWKHRRAYHVSLLPRGIARRNIAAVDA